MKKFVIGVVTAVCVVILSIGLIACTTTKGPEGNYELESVIVNGTTYNAWDTIPADKFTGKDYVVRNNDMIVVIGEKGPATGSFSYQRSFGGGLVTGGGLWSENDDGEITFSFHTDPNGTFAMEYEGDGEVTFSESLYSSKGEMSITYILKRT